MILSVLITIGLMFQRCGGDDPEPDHADGHIHGTVVVHDDDAGATDDHEVLVGATVEMWFNKSSATGTADYSTTTDATGFFEFEELEHGIYFITASGIDDEAIAREGSALVELTEASHEADVELEVE